MRHGRHDKCTLYSGGAVVVCTEVLYNRRYGWVWTGLLDEFANTSCEIAALGALRSGKYAIHQVRTALALASVMYASTK